ncbi:MAG: hypothetical protein P1V81_02580 [Planctomycetota bacterium]|nr:hypothetical protein [Planctomycetota bacterium]
MTLRTWVQLEREGSGQADELLERLRQLDGLAETYGGIFDGLDAWGDSH